MTELEDKAKATMSFAKIDDIEETTLEVLRATSRHASAYDAAVAFAKTRIEAGRMPQTA